jgi:hypothetical protein
VLKDGMPIRSGKLTVTGTGPTGKTVTVVQDAPKRPGIFGPVVAFPEPGRNERVQSQQCKNFGGIRAFFTRKGSQSQ